jgi:hypothetical protein
MTEETTNCNLNNIVMEDPKGVLTKTQKKKIRKLVSECWNEEEEDLFHEELDKILEKIHYEDEKDRYNVCKFEHSKHNQCMTLQFEQVHIQTKEERHEELRKKLREKRGDGERSHKKHRQDPVWEMYTKIRNRLPVSNKNIIPNPDEVRNNMDTYRAMMSMLPSQNPIHEYLSMLIPASA